jgi:hypothetical protein
MIEPLTELELIGLEAFLVDKVEKLKVAGEEAAGVVNNRPDTEKGSEPYMWDMQEVVKITAAIQAYENMLKLLVDRESY